MPNRPSLQRGGPREQAVLEALRNGATRQAAAAAGGVSRRTFFRHMERSGAFQHDVALAEDEAERRATSVVYSAAMGGDTKAAMFWLERRRPVEWRQQTQVDGRTVLEQEYPPEVLALARRYGGLSAEETAAEIRRLAWVVPADVAGEGRSADGGATAIPLLPVAPTDKTPETATAATESTEAPEPGANGRLSPAQPAEGRPPLVLRPEDPPTKCPHCRGAHQAGCPIAVDTIRIDAGDLRRLMGGGDPR